MALALCWLFWFAVVLAVVWVLPTLLGLYLVGYAIWGRLRRGGEPKVMLSFQPIGG